MKRANDRPKLLKIPFEGRMQTGLPPNRILPKGRGFVNRKMSQIRRRAEQTGATQVYHKRTPEDSDARRQMVWGGALSRRVIFVIFPKKLAILTLIGSYFARFYNFTF